MRKSALALLAIGVLVFAGAFFFRNGPGSLGLERVQGLIAGHAVAPVESEEHGPAQRSVVSYSYRVGAASYIGSYHTEGPDGDSRLFEAYPVGSRVTVLHRAGDGGDAFLDQGLTVPVLALMGAGAYLAVLGLMVYGYALVREV